MQPTTQEPIHVTVPGSPSDPRSPDTGQPGVVIHHAAQLHPDDFAVVDGFPVTSVARTLVDLAEVETREGLVAAFARAGALGLLDMAAVEASFARAEWRPSLQMLREVMDTFSP